MDNIKKRKLITNTLALIQVPLPNLEWEVSIKNNSKHWCILAGWSLFIIWLTCMKYIFHSKVETFLTFQIRIRLFPLACFPLISPGLQILCGEFRVKISESSKSFPLLDRRTYHAAEYYLNENLVSVNLMKWMFMHLNPQITLSFFFNRKV